MRALVFLPAALAFSIAGAVLILNHSPGTVAGERGELAEPASALLVSRTSDFEVAIQITPGLAGRNHVDIYLEDRTGTGPEVVAVTLRVMIPVPRTRQR